MSIGAPVACIHHPDREAMGICVRCRVRYCSECITKVDGVNHCAACLAERSAAESLARADVAGTSLAASRVRAALYFVLLSALAWGLVEAVFPAGSG